MLSNLDCSILKELDRQSIKSDVISVVMNRSQVQILSSAPYKQVTILYFIRDCFKYAKNNFCKHFV